MKTDATWIQTLIDRAVNQAGIITVFLTLAGFGMGGLLLGPQQALWVALVALGVGGALEVLHRQGQTKMMEMRQAERFQAQDAMMIQAIEAHPSWQPKLFKQFQHGGVLWNAIGFKELPFPVTVAGPLCPRCKSNLAERLENRFPGRLRVTAWCHEQCGFKKSLDQASSILRQEAHSLARTPV